MRRWRVLIDWVEGTVEDTDEIVVCAKTAAGAASKARAVWSVTNRAECPQIRIQKVFVVTPKRLRSLL
jgi:hypothetical protein